jgi:hypothetical protein
MSVLWINGAEVILPLGHASPLLVHGAGHVGHFEVHLGQVSTLLVHVAGHDGHCEVHLVSLLGDSVDLVAGHVGPCEVHLVPAAPSRS